MSLQDAVISDVAEQCVLEEELPRLFERRVLALVHHLPGPQVIEAVADRWATSGAAEPVRGPGSARRRPRTPVRPPRPAAAYARSSGGKRIEPGLEHAPQRRRNPSAVDPVFEHAPRLGLLGDHARFEEPLDQLLDVEGVAVGGRHDEIAERGRNVARPSGGSRRAAVGCPAATATAASSRAWKLRPSPQCGWRSSSAGRAVATTSTRLAARNGSAASIQASELSSAQCRSSSSITTGDSSARSAEALGHVRDGPVAQDLRSR